MNRTFFEELPARKAGGPVVSANTQKSSDGEGGNTEEKSAKRIRQAVYDIRYRARREDIDLKAAYSQYMGNTTMTGPEKDAVKQKLFGEAYSPIQKQIIANKEETIKKMKRTFEGPHHDQNKYGEPVEEETKGEGADKKYKIRVTDKTSGRTYVRFATREKINSLRANPNIKSVEMTEYGQAYEGEAKKGEQTAATKSGKGLDPVGKEDKDVDNDGDHDKSDKYLLKRRSAIGKAMASRNEEVEQVDEIAPVVAIPLAVGAGYAAYKGIKHLQKKANSALDDARKRTTLKGNAFGGDLRMKGVQKNSFEPEGEVLEAAPIPRTDVRYDKHMKQYVPTGGVPVRRARGGPALPGEPGRPGSGGGGRPLLPGEKPFPRLAKKKANTQMSSYEPEGEEISEREMTAGEKKKEGHLKDKYDKSGMKASMKKQYGSEKGEKVYFATIRKQAMEAVEESFVSRSRRKELEKEMEGREDKEKRTPFTTGKGAKPYHTKKESTQFYDWRTQFLEQMGNEIDAQTKEKVTEKNFTNKVVINPKQGTASN
ncbi:hypothetical protein HOU04_gp136 [Synechococcus phage S-T4]|jgi:hypothetical protein|uniref:Uncharacterized protein n=1 Tax=Synechococcus phage S-T4 TaxID=2268578 RepID=A0A385EGZ1_9CAUD|nr:hypothetical protein HOU04_gp136 [Synechococcus phage S-T4]AXQ70535.1 hypothetical protein [Synechococcus phage S-T4]